MNKKSKIVLTILIIIFVICIGIYLYLVKKSNDKLETSLDEAYNYGQENNQENSSNNEITDDEKISVTDYINIICNNTMKITEFANINEADKEWIYSHLLTNGKEYGDYLTEQQIKDDLSEIFGSDLIIDVEKDTESSDGKYIPIYNKENENYEFIPSGDEITVQYAIDSIEKENDKYIVNVVEYSIERDLESSNPDEDYAVFAYNKMYDDEWKNWTKVFEKDTDDNSVIAEKVLSQKDKFQSYSFTLVKDENGNLSVKSFEKNN
jgi:hypothetical protein